MRAAVDDVGHRHGQHFRIRPAEILEHRLAQLGGGGFRVGQGHGQDRVGSEDGLGFRAVEVNHDPVHGQLVHSILPAQRRENLGGDILDGLGHAFAEITALVAVAQFNRFIFPGAGA